MLGIAPGELLAIVGPDGEVRLAAKARRVFPDYVTFWVLNGAWEGAIDADGFLTVRYDGNQYAGNAVAWHGRLPDTEDWQALFDLAVDRAALAPPRRRHLSSRAVAKILWDEEEEDDDTDIWSERPRTRSGPRRLASR